MPYEELQFFTEDGVSLKGWFIPQSSGGRLSRRVIVCCHPYNWSKSNLLGLVLRLWERRYSVFLFDFRSFSHSPGNQSLGYLEQRDARAAIACAKRAAPEGAMIGIVGASMGGAVALIVGHEAASEAVGIASDCAFADLESLLVSRVQTRAHIPACVAALVVQIATFLNPLFFSYSLADVSPAAVVAAGGSERAGEVPLLLLHAANDDVIPISHLHAIHSAAAAPPEKKHQVVYDHCDHVGCFFVDREGYVKLLTDFFDEHFATLEKEARAASAATSDNVATGDDTPGTR